MFEVKKYTLLNTDKMKDYYSKLYPNGTYHIYNHANGFEKLFISDNNYSFFLSKYQKYILPIADTYCYCLMPNHFHFLIKIKPIEELVKYFEENNFPEIKKITSLSMLTPKLISIQFSRLFNSYTQSFNNQNNRMGSLFCRPFKRLLVDCDNYFYNAIVYIHYNPVKSGLCNDPNDWKYSSYSAFTTNKQSFIKKDEVLLWFDNMKNFVLSHQLNNELTDIEFFK